MKRARPSLTPKTWLETALGQSVEVIPAETCDRIIDAFLEEPRMCHWCAQSFTVSTPGAFWHYCSDVCLAVGNPDAYQRFCEEP